MAMLDFDSQFIDCPIAALNAAGVYDAAYKLLTSRGLELKSRGNNWLSTIYRQTIKGQWL